jgi:hypothetical protein
MKMDTNLAAREDAATILKLYELRTEPVMREARSWVAGFRPSSAAEVLAVIGSFGSEENRCLRQVTSYWEMAAALVNHGILAAPLFCDTNGEPFFVLAKFWPYLAEIRQQAPGFLKQLDLLCEQSSQARQRLEAAMAAQEKRRVAVAVG